MNNATFYSLPLRVLSLLIRNFLALREKINFRALLILGYILIISLLSFYIFQVNSSIKEVYLIQDYEKKLDSLSEKEKKLEGAFLQSNYLENFDDLAQNLNFEKTNKVRYIQVADRLANK